MKAFSNLLSDLILTSSRNRKLSLISEYFRATPDPDRGFALGALTGSLNFKNIKGSFFKELIKEKQDAYLFDLSYDYVGDLAETVALLLWPTNRINTCIPKLSHLIVSLKNDRNVNEKILMSKISEFLKFLIEKNIRIKPIMSPRIKE